MQVRRLLFLPLLAAAALIPAASANAGLLVASATNCGTPELSKTFSQWGDFADYMLAPDGAFEGGGAGWSLGSADVVSANEPYFVHDAADSHALSLSQGESVTTDTICVGLAHPTMRFFERKTSGLTASIGVEVLFEDSTGAVRSMPIGTVAGTSSWQPTQQILVLANLLPLLPGDLTPIQFRFTALSGSFQIDDTYVDPFHKP